MDISMWNIMHNLLDFQLIHMDIYDIFVQKGMWSR